LPSTIFPVPITSLNNTFEAFRIESKQLFLTYPQCILEPAYVAQYFKDQFRLNILKEYLIVREFHRDGRPHIHAYLSFKKN
jgi:hypothetical protein